MSAHTEHGLDQRFQWLRNVRFSKVRLEARAISPLWLPAFKGNTFRGAFGAALRNLVCIGVSHSCERCLIAERCPYVAIFEPRNHLSWLATTRAPSPFVLVPLDEHAEYIERGEHFALSLLLIGPAIQFLPYFILVWKTVGSEYGLGKARHAGFGLFELTAAFDALEQRHTPLYLADRGTFASGPQVQALDHYVAASGLAGSDDCPIEVVFTTPLRIQSEGHLLGPSEPHKLTPKRLLEAIYRRLYILAAAYGEERLPPLQMPDFPEEPPLSQALAWKEWERYSARQSSTMRLGGVVGDIVLPESFGKFWPLLAAAELLHVGKATSFGFGALSCRRLRPVAPRAQSCRSGNE